MKTFFSFWLIGLVIPFCTFAQNPKWVAGIHIQPQYTFFYNSDDFQTKIESDKADVSNNIRLNYAFGMEIGRYFSPKLSLRAMLRYSKMSLKQTWELPDPKHIIGNIEYSSETAYLSLPVVLSYHSSLENRVYLKADLGISFNYSLYSSAYYKDYWWPQPFWAKSLLYQEIVYEDGTRNSTSLSYQNEEVTQEYKQSSPVSDPLFNRLALGAYLRLGLGVMVTENLGLEFGLVGDVALTNTQNKDTWNRVSGSTMYSQYRTSPRPSTHNVAIGMSLGAVYYWGKR